MILWRKSAGCAAVTLHKVDHVGWANATLEEEARGLQRASRQNDTAILCEGDNAVGSQRSIIRLNSGNLRPVTNNIGDKSVLLVRKVGSDLCGLEVSSNRAAAETIDEL